MAERFGTRPSVLLGVDEPWIAYCLDEALHVKAAIADAEERGDATHQRELGRLTEAELARIPWRGEGPDPLAREGETP